MLEMPPLVLGASHLLADCLGGEARECNTGSKCRCPHVVNQLAAQAEINQHFRLLLFRFHFYIFVHGAKIKQKYFTRKNYF